MSFTVSEKSKIRGFLGYPNQHLYLNTRLENALTTAEGQPTEDEARDLIAKIDAVQAALNSDAIDVAGIQGAGKSDILFYQGAKIRELKTIGRTLCSQLSIKIGQELKDDYFGVGPNAVVAGLSNGFY